MRTFIGRQSSISRVRRAANCLGQMLLLGAVWCGDWALPAGGQAVLLVETNDRGEIRVEARQAALGETLRAIATESGFEIVMDEAVQRPPVDVIVSAAPVEAVLRQVLRGRNYALYYGGDGSLRRVIVLPPSTPSRRLPYRPPARRPIRRR